MVCTSLLSTLGMDQDRLQMNGSSLAHILVKITCSHLSRTHPDTELLTLLVGIMCNFSLSPDTLSVICKVGPLVLRLYALLLLLVFTNYQLFQSNLAQSFSCLSSRLSGVKKHKLQSPLTRLWLNFYLNMSYSVEGQKVIMDTKGTEPFLPSRLRNRLAIS